MPTALNWRLNLRRILVSILCAELLLFYIGLTAVPYRAEQNQPLAEAEFHLNEPHLKNGLAQGRLLFASPAASF
ncbi:hypothetical protein [Paenibacillus senegalensis]|uniref:hypothetical protein n=1 Tax=Paenibacillus senegalensis TaxID=1465766 RepID=UPI000289A0E6|nr:hypothetical protein [Paenibacillus senegalensis]